MVLLLTWRGSFQRGVSHAHIKPFMYLDERQMRKMTRTKRRTETIYDICIGRAWLDLLPFISFLPFPPPIFLLSPSRLTSLHVAPSLRKSSVSQPVPPYFTMFLLLCTLMHVSACQLVVV
mmetsp:Transcript_8287/g.22017  ORF Transcript_8287/g.22017 Transcript_8287/m.22017 type:complete len:120 (-) Transcript_8287:126-485(-)